MMLSRRGAGVTVLASRTTPDDGCGGWNGRIAISTGGARPVVTTVRPDRALQGAFTRPYVDSCIAMQNAALFLVETYHDGIGSISVSARFP